MTERDDHIETLLVQLQRPGAEFAHLEPELINRVFSESARVH